MHDAAENQKKNRPSKTRKVFKWSFIISAGVVLLFFFGIPPYLSSSSGTTLLLGKINAAVDGQVTMDDFSMGWLKGVELTKLFYADSSGNTSVSADHIQTHPKYTSLLGGKIKLGKTVVQSPQVHLKVSPDKEPLPTPGSKTHVEMPSQPPSDVDAPPPVFPINQIDLELIDGDATVELAGSLPQTISLRNIASKVQFDQAKGTGALDVTMDVNDDASVAAKGRITTSKTGWTLKAADFDVKITKLQLASLKPLFALAGQEMDLTGELNADATVKIDGKAIEQLKVDAVVTDLTQGVGQQRIVFDQPVTINAATAGSGDDIQIETFKVRSQFFNADCSGTAKSINYDIRRVNLAQTQQILEQFQIDMGKLSMAGDLSLKGVAGITDSATALTGKGQIKQFQVQSDTRKTGAIDLQLDFEGVLDDAKGQLRMPHTNLVATLGTIKISDLVFPLSDEADKTVSLNARVHQMDLSKAWPFAQVLLDDYDNITIQGQANTSHRITTTGSQIRFQTEQSTIDNLRIMLPDSEPFVQDQVTLNADILMDTEDQTIDIRALHMKSRAGETLIDVTKGRVKKKVTKTQTQMDGHLEAEYDWRMMSALASSYLPEGLSLKGKRTSSIRFDSAYPTDTPDLMTANLNADGNIGFDSAEYMGLVFGPTEVKMSIRKGLVDVTIPQTTVNEGTFQFAGLIDLNEESRFLRLKEPTQIVKDIHINDKMTHTMLKYLSPVFAKQSNVSGFASLSCNELEIPFDLTDKNKIVLDGNIRMDKVRLKAVGAVGDILARTSNRSEFDAKLLPSRFVLSDGVLEYTDMEFHLDAYPTGFSGKIYVNKTVDMQVAVPYKFNVQELDFDTVKIGEDLSSRLSLPIKGTVDDPDIRLEKMFESILEKSAPQLIQRGLEELLKNL